MQAVRILITNFDILYIFANAIFSAKLKTQCGEMGEWCPKSDKRLNNCKYIKYVNEGNVRKIG